MAGDWIKMRVDLGDDPAVVMMSSICDVSEDDIVGKLHRLWSWADRHTTDGTAPAITPRWVDKYVGLPGFAAAMQTAGWILFTEFGVQFPKFEHHNGESAKRRAENTIRQRLSRENRDNGMTGAARDLIPRPFTRHVFARDGYTCVYCDTKSSEQREAGRKAIMSVDHLIPVSRGGATVVENLVCSCRACNNEKNDRTPEEWGVEPSFLQAGVRYVGGRIVTDQSQNLSDNSVTKALPEKRREDKEEREDSRTDSRKRAVEYDPLNVRLPEWLPPEVWRQWVGFRAEIKKPLKETTVNQQIQALAAWRERGHNPVEVLESSIRNGWQGLFEPKGARKDPPQPPARSEWL